MVLLNHHRLQQPSAEGERASEGLRRHFPFQLTLHPLGEFCQAHKFQLCAYSSTECRCSVHFSEKEKTSSLSVFVDSCFKEAYFKC